MQGDARHDVANEVARAVDAGRAVLVVGAAGMGKSTLAATTLRRKRAVTAQCLEVFRGLPYRPLSHAFHAPLGGTADDVATEIAAELDRRTLLVEDVHWADAATMATIGRLSGRVPMLLTSRTRLPELDREGVEVVELEPLGEVGAAALARAAHPELDDDEIHQLVRVAGGNPLLLTHLAEPDSVWPTLEDAVGHRVRTLPAATRDALGRLALHGRPATAEFVGLTEPAAVGPLIVDDDDTVWFSHERLAQTTLAALGDDDIRRLRTELAGTSAPADAARHFRDLGDLARAAASAEVAASDATPTERAALLELAVDCLARAAPPELLLRAADASIAAYRPDAARRLALRVADGSDPAVAAEAGLHLARAAWLEGDWAEARSRAEEALDRVAATGSPIAARLLVEQASQAVRTRVGDPAIVELADQAVAAAERTQVDQARALNTAGLARSHSGRPGWEELFRQAIGTLPGPPGRVRRWASFATVSNKAGRLLLVVLVSLTAAACGDDDDDADDGGGGSGTTTVATFQVAGDETYKIELATPELIAHAERLLAGEQIAAIPLGTVVRDDPGVNEPWSWHIDPSTLEFADVTIEVCDGLPSHVEDGIVTSDQYCPWSAKVIAVDRL